MRLVCGLFRGASLAGLLALLSGVCPARAQARPAAAAPDAARIEYRNARYGFCFALPGSWQGFSIVAGEWKGGSLDGGPDVAGPLLRIRHPAWTKDNPHEDIPIMVFTRDEWRRIEKEGLSVSAAPIPPSELSRTAHYVFALPARYNFDFAAGYEDVDALIRQHALRAPCPPTGAGGANHP